MNDELITQQLDKALSEKDDKVLRMRVEVLRDFVAEMAKTKTTNIPPARTYRSDLVGPQPSQPVLSEAPFTEVNSIEVPSIDLQGGKSPRGAGALVGGDDLVKYSRPSGT